jgi:MYXO-CTERM domain-containing protein
MSARALVRSSTFRDDIVRGGSANRCLGSAMVSLATHEFPMSTTLPRVRRGATLALLLAGPASLFPARAFADNPIVQTIYTADPAPMVYDGKVYLYTGHDEDKLVNNFFTMNDWRVYSSADMVNWTDHGSPLSYKSFTWSSGDAWAGQVVPRNGKFYFYVPTNLNGGKVLGVAVSDSPTGPFKDALGKPLLTSDCGTIDPTVFIDDDGQAYLYWGNPNLCYVKLNADMTSYQGSVVHIPMTTASFGVRSKTDRPTTYEEGPWFYKRASHYYMVFAAGPISEHIGYAMSTSPTGPWTYGGVVMPTQGASFTNHPGVIDYKGKSYFFYHNGALPDGGGFHRSVAVEEFTYGADGKIPQIKMTTAGPAAVATLNPYDLNEAETIAWESGIETEVCSKGGMDVTAISSGDYIKVENVDFGTGATSFTARVAATAAGGSIQIRLGSQTGTLVGTCNVAATGGTQTWANTTCTVNGATGIKDLFFVFSGSTFNFDNWKFTGTGGGTGTGGSGGTSSSGGSAAIGGNVATGGNVAAGGTTSTGGSSNGETSVGGKNGGIGSTSASTNTTRAGTSPMGGMFGSGGAVASGGLIGDLGGASMTSGTGTVTDGEGSDADGCSCRIADAPSRSKSFALLGILGLWLLRSARKHHRS